MPLPYLLPFSHFVILLGRRPIIRYFFLTRETDKTPIVLLRRGAASTSDEYKKTQASCYMLSGEIGMQARCALLAHSPKFPALAPVNKVNIFFLDLCADRPRTTRWYPGRPFPYVTGRACALLSLAVPDSNDLAVSTIPGQVPACRGDPRQCEN